MHNMVVENEEEDVKLNLDFWIQQTSTRLEQYSVPTPLSSEIFSYESVNAQCSSPILKWFHRPSMHFQRKSKNKK